MEKIISGYDNRKSMEEEGEPLLECVKEARVFELERTEQGMFRLAEMFDGYFIADLTKEQVIRLATEIRAFAELAFYPEALVSRLVGTWPHRVADGQDMRLFPVDLKVVGGER